MNDFIASMGEYERYRISHWLEDPKFNDFANANVLKIRAKFGTNVPIIDRQDALAELAVAAKLLQCPQITLEYEPLGEGPDFRATISGTMVCFIEVKHLRLSYESATLESFMTRLIQELLRNEPKVCYSINMHSECHDVGNYSLQKEPSDRLISFAKYIADHGAEVFEKSKAAINGRLESGFVDGTRVKVNAGPGMVEITLFNEEERDPIMRTGYLGGSASIPFKERDYEKIRSDIVDKLRQCQPASTNVLVIVSTSDTHDEFDFNQAVHELVQKVTRNDDSYFQRMRNKGSSFKSAADFLIAFQKLSVVAFQPKFRKNPGDYLKFELWHNPFASFPLSNSDVLVDVMTS